jgi:hypothetical protein
VVPVDCHRCFDLEPNMTQAQTMLELADEKVCNSCKVLKPASEFGIWTRPGGRKYLAPRCRECKNSYHRTPERRAAKSDYLAQHRDRESRKRADRIHQQNRQQKYPEKTAAKLLVRRALEAGELSRPEACQRCGIVPKPLRDGRSAIQGHHPDYTKPLEVEWLCHRCHVAQHRQENAA